MSQPPAKTWTETLNISVQFVVLLVSLFLGIEAWMGNRAANQREAFVAGCRRAVQRLAVLTEPDLYVQARLRPLFRAWSTKDLPTLGRRVDALHTAWHLETYAYAFNPAGELLAAFPPTAPNLWSMKQLYQGLIARSETAFTDARRKIDKKLPFIFGDGKDLAIIRRDRGKTIEVFAKADRGFLLWNRWAGGGIILHCPVLPTEDSVFRDILAAPSETSEAARTSGPGADKTPEALFTGLGRPDTATWNRAGREADPQATQAREELRRQQREEGEVAGRWWVFMETLSGRTIYAAFPPAPDSLGPIRHLARATGGLGLIVGLGMILMYGLTAALTLRRILLALFLAAALIPLLGIAIGSLDVVQVFQAVLGTRIQAVQDEAIRNVVQEFDGFVASCAAILRSATADPAALTDEPGRRRMIRRLQKLQLVNVLQMRDAGGNLLHTYGSRLSSDRETMVRAMARRSVERYFPDRIGEASYTPNVFADSMVRRDDMGFSTFLNHPGELQTLQMGLMRFLFFFQNPPRSCAPVAYVDILVSLSKVVANYLRLRNTRRLVYDQVWLRFYALEVPDFHWTIAPPPAFRREITQMSLASWLSGQPQSQWLGRVGTGGGFAVAIACPELANHCLVAFYPDELLRERISTVWQKISLGAIFLLGLVGLMGFGISRQFLAPLRNLEEGVAALAARDFDFRMPVAGNDEIAHLFYAFNEMMIDSRDLQLARSVQEGLVPQSFPQPAGYSLHGRLETASDLGGDCLDCFSLAGDRIVFLVGDITGHGVGSALLMAFSRAITFHWSQGQALYPESLTADLDRMMRRQHATRQFSGVVCGILDPVNHQLDLVIRGRIFPLHLAADGTCRWAAPPEEPSKSSPEELRPIRLPLEPGDGLLCLTDGFVDGCSASREPIGTPRVEEWARQFRQPSAANWVDALFARHAEWCGNRREDDLTVFGIIRKEGDLL